MSRTARRVGRYADSGDIALHRRSHNAGEFGASGGGGEESGVSAPEGPRGASAEVVDVEGRVVVVVGPYEHHSFLLPWCVVPRARGHLLISASCLGALRYPRNVMRGAIPCRECS